MPEPTRDPVERRWEEGIPHDPRSEELFAFLEKIDFECGDMFGWKSGGDGDNGETLMYQLDEYFAQRDATPPAGVVCYIARDTGVREFGDTWLYAAHPGTPDDDGAYNNGRLADVIGRMPLEWSKALGLAPGECAAFRITREEAGRWD